MSHDTTSDPTVKPRAKDLKVEFAGLSIDPDKHPEMKAAMLATAQAAVADFPAQFALVTNALEKNDALGIVATVCNYGLRTYVSNEGVERPTGRSKIEQHHAELLQAILLTIPEEDIGRGLPKQNVTQAVFDTLPKLSDAFFYRRIIDADRIRDRAELLVLSLQERIRLHTQAVRNWGYFDEVFRLTRDLFHPLDADLSVHFGFSATDLIETMFAVVREYERRNSEHFKTLKKVFRGNTPRQVAKLYYKHIADIEGTPEELLAKLPGITTWQLKAMMMAHCDLRLAERAQFTPEELAAITGKPVGVIESICRELSMPLGALSNSKPEHLFLGNPVWERPFVDLGGTFFVPIPQMAFSHIHRIMDRLAGAANIKERVSSRRARFLESELEDVFRRMFPDADLHTAVKWRVGDQQFETDLLVLVDRTVVIAEAKSHRLTAEGLRGAPDRVKRHIRDMVLDPSLQSERLERLIIAARDGDAVAAKVLASMKINAAIVDRVVRVSVTLDDLSVLSSAEPDFKKVGWVAEDHSLAPAISIADLICIAEILESPLLFLHYLSERPHLQRSLKLMGDELDFLGLYLATGFNLGALAERRMHLVMAGMSEAIDQYYMSREVGVRLPKPKAELSPLFRQIIARLVQTKPPGWTTVGIHLLSCADPAEQMAIERSLADLRKTVRKNYRDPDHLNSIQIEPSGERKARVIFHVFPEKHRGILKETMEQLAATALEEEGVESCVVLARGTETWERAYDVVMLVQPSRVPLSEADSNRSLVGHALITK